MSDRDLDTIEQALNGLADYGKGLDALARVRAALEAKDEALRAMLTAIEKHADPSAPAVPTGQQVRRLIPSLRLRNAMSQAHIALVASRPSEGEET